MKTAKSLNLYVDEYPQTSFFSLLDSLQSNYVVERIEVFRKRTTHEEIRTRTLEDMDNLFHVINDLSTLAELVVWNFHPKELSSLCHGISDKISIKYLQFRLENYLMDLGFITNNKNPISVNKYSEFIDNKNYSCSSWHNDKKNSKRIWNSDFELMFSLHFNKSYKNKASWVLFFLLSLLLPLTISL